MEKQSITEDAIPPECRLGVCLYRLGRGDYYYTLAELSGLGEATICLIVIEVCQVMVHTFWMEEVSNLFPENQEELNRAMELMDEEWQFPCAYAAIDGCHIPIRCPPGGAEAAKEFHNFKNFYSVILMAIVDAKYRIIWGSCGYPGNSHDSIIFQSTDVYKDLASDRFKNVAHREGNVDIPPILLGDGAFPFHNWMMKPYSQAVLSTEQKYFNYRLSRARMVTEGAFGKLKGRWRVLYRKCESTANTMKAKTLACVVLHNICIRRGDVNLRQWDLTCDTKTNQRRPGDVVRDMLQMSKCQRLCDTNKQAEKVRDTLKEKFAREKVGRN